ncbi:unnamed protein product [Effrenium voratum]|uniref:Uncharacterized protein n=1 Tax=Effrenium voratum TaxID=2562239 RepID=A0AA36MLD4_9DINO|nr:unnamed protein product [Effrenium voratum]CAJ1371492.1 unnamed protein product [Effrenium voratum]
MPPSGMGATGRYEEYSQKEIHFIENELKDWFLQRRFAMERNMALKKTLDQNNFTGLSMANQSVPDAQKVMWSDLVQGKPELEDTLSSNAKQMKADMYSKMFKESTDLDHPCRVAGSTYTRCLQENFKEKSSTRMMKCLPSFETFDACRKGVMQQQAQSLENALVKQDIADRRAKALFDRRSILLDTQSC